MKKPLENPITFHPHNCLVCGESGAWVPVDPWGARPGYVHGHCQKEYKARQEDGGDKEQGEAATE